MRRTKWTVEDLQRLAVQHALLGNKWALLSKMFHKTDAQVKNIFHSVGRSKGGFHKCPLLYLYAKSVKGCADDPEARKAALRHAQLAAHEATARSSPRPSPTAEHLRRVGDADSDNVMPENNSRDDFAEISDGSTSDELPDAGKVSVHTEGTSMMLELAARSGCLFANSDSASESAVLDDTCSSQDRGAAPASCSAAALPRGLLDRQVSPGDPAHNTAPALSCAGVPAAGQDCGLGRSEPDGTAAGYNPDRDPLLLLRALTSRGPRPSAGPPPPAGSDPASSSQPLGVPTGPIAAGAAAVEGSGLQLTPRYLTTTTTTEEEEEEEAAEQEEQQEEPEPSPGSPGVAPGFGPPMASCPREPCPPAWDMDDMSPFVAVAALDGCGLSDFRGCSGGGGSGSGGAVAGGIGERDAGGRQYGSHGGEIWHAQAFASSADGAGASQRRRTTGAEPEPWVGGMAADGDGGANAAGCGGAAVLTSWGAERATACDIAAVACPQPLTLDRSWSAVVAPDARLGSGPMQCYPGITDARAYPGASGPTAAILPGDAVSYLPVCHSAPAGLGNSLPACGSAYLPTITTTTTAAATTAAMPATNNPAITATGSLVAPYSWASGPPPAYQQAFVPHPAASLQSYMQPAGSYPSSTDWLPAPAPAPANTAVAGAAGDTETAMACVSPLPPPMAQPQQLQQQQYQQQQYQQQQQQQASYSEPERAWVSGPMYGTMGSAAPWCSWPSSYTAYAAPNSDTGLLYGRHSLPAAAPSLVAMAGVGVGPGGAGLVCSPQQGEQMALVQPLPQPLPQPQQQGAFTSMSAPSLAVGAGLQQPATGCAVGELGFWSWPE